jgi:hypothetical protein
MALFHWRSERFLARDHRVDARCVEAGARIVQKELQMRQVWMLVLVVGCSAGAEPSRSVRSAAPSSGSQGAAVDDSAGVDNLENPNGFMPLMAAGAGAAPTAPTSSSAGTGAAGAASLANGCMAGKFCPPSVPDPLDCGTLTLEQDVKVTRGGNLLLVFDQSASMSEAWGSTGQTKLQSAQVAISNAIRALGDSLDVGAIFFPTLACMPGRPGEAQRPGPGAALSSSVAPISAPEQIAFAPAADFLQRWDEHWLMAGAGSGIGTPMQEAFDQADLAIQSSVLEGPLAVVAVTDGAPNCFPNPLLSMTPTALETERASAWLATKGIKTYVVGLPGAGGVSVLNDVAQSGGTMQYILPDDPKALEDKLREVVGETIKARFDSCSITLTPAADPIEKLKLIVVETENGQKSQVPRMLTTTAGWTISADGSQVEITGELCEDAKAGRFSSLTFEYGCKDKDVPDLPPPPPLN